MYPEYSAIQKAPPIITTMIDIFLAGASNEQTIVGQDGKETTTIKYFYVMDGQKGASIALVLIAFVMVPLMLCVKPLAMRSKLKNHGHGPHVHVESDSI